MADIEKILINNDENKLTDSRIGNLEDLNTTDKTSIVSAINEIVDIDEIIGSGVIE